MYIYMWYVFVGFYMSINLPFKKRYIIVGIRYRYQQAKLTQLINHWEKIN